MMKLEYPSVVVDSTTRSDPEAGVVWDNLIFSVSKILKIEVSWLFVSFSQ